MTDHFTGDEVAALIRAAAGDWSGATLEEHVREAFRVIKRVIPHDALAAYLIPAANTPALPLFSESIDESALVDYPRHYRQFDPMAEAFGDPSAPVQTLTASATKQGMSLDLSVFVNEFLVPRTGIRKILGTNMLVGKDATLAVSLHRRRGLPDFTEKEILAMRLAMAGLSRSFSLTFSHDQSLRALEKRPAAGRSESSGIATFSQDLRLLRATAAAREILLELEREGGTESLLASGARLLGSLREDRARSFVDTSAVRRLARAVVIIRMFATRTEPDGELALEILLDLVPSAAGVLLQRIAAPYGLTRRELDVLGLLHDGRTQVEIANELGIAATSVREHLVNVRRKVGAATNEQILPRLLGLS